MTFALLHLCLVTAGTLAVSSAQTVTYLGRPLRDRTAAGSTRPPPRSPAHTLPLVDELSVLLSESRRLLARRGHSQGGQQRTAARRAGPGRVPAGAGGATYLSAALYPAAGLADRAAKASTGNSANDSGRENRPQEHSTFLAADKQSNFLDQTLSPRASGGVHVWRKLDSTVTSKSGIGEDEPKLLTKFEDDQDILAHESSYTSYEASSSSVTAERKTTAAVPSGTIPLWGLPIVALSSTTADSRASGGRKRSPSATFSPTMRPGTGGARFGSKADTGSAGVADDGSTATSTPAGRDNVPGRPGRDYPTFSKPPVTGFSCRGKVPGMYADFETRCQVWHFCHENGHHRFLCVAGTVFSPISRTCDWWYNVDCRYDAFPPF
ncbi:uncharacterized protein LOC122383460 [Amphibalanus amphitrite]|nr:uncharacterized protein LOC122383460 [Amphibalanus amphitrite]